MVNKMFVTSLESRLITLKFNLQDLVEEVESLLELSQKKRKGRKRGQRAEDLTGQRFGRLEVKEKTRGKYIKSRDVYRVAWVCVCDCGNTVTVRADTLKNGDTTSCGCYQKEVVSKQNWRHGHARYTKGADNRSPTYLTWESMIQRCHNKNNNNWKYYGGKGISVCKRWKDDFTNFLEDMGERPEGSVIHRKDRKGNYSSRNCEWMPEDEHVELHATQRRHHLPR